MFDRVLILSASAGAGHLRAAEAVERAFQHDAARAHEVRNIDVLQHTNPLFRNLYSKTYLDMVNSMPEVLGWLYDRLDDPGKDDRLLLTFEKLNARPFLKLLEPTSPIRRLHPLAAGRPDLLAQVGRPHCSTAGDRRHRLRRARDVALPALRAVFRRDARVGYHWVPGHWVAHGPNYHWVEGHWA